MTASGQIREARERVRIRKAKQMAATLRLKLSKQPAPGVSQEKPRPAAAVQGAQCGSSVSEGSPTREV
jgi:hypothetical protein